MSHSHSGDGVAVLVFLVLGVVLLGNFPGCGGGGGGGRATYTRGRDAGRLAAENARLQEAQRQAAERLAVERHRSDQLVDEIGTRQHVEAMMVGVVVLGGCALAVTFYALARRRRNHT